MIGTWIRKNTFWFIDSLKGGIIRKHLKDIKNIMGNNNISKNQLNKLINHAKNTTLFYKQINENNRLNKIENYPIITKYDIKKNFKAFQSTKYKNKKLHKMSTSGSTGTPFTVNQNINKRQRVIAEIIYLNELAGQTLGDKYIWFRVWTEKNKKTKIEQFMQNMIPINILHLDDNKLEKIRNLLKENNTINSALAYASTYEHLVNYLKKSGDKADMFNINLLISSSEVLTMKTKKIIKETIGCDIIDRYSNQENGIIAQTLDLSEEFIVNRASYYVELLKLNSNEPAEKGELGRIVVTDLYNFAMPIIRYDTGDLAIKCSETRNNGGLSKFKSVQGRRVDTIYDTDGNRLTAHTWSVYMWKFNKLDQYQFIQEDAKKYLLKVSGAKGIYTKKELDKTLRDILGDDAEINIHFVDKIPVLDSGKFKKTVCNYKP